MKEAQIMELLQCRSEHALEELERSYGGICTSIVRKILHDNRDVEEVVSDGYLRVWNTIPPERPRSLVAYLCRIMRNAALDRYDYNTAAKRNPALTTAFEELEAVLPTAQDGIAHLTERSELSEFINGFLRNLKQDTRRCFVRRYWYGQSIGEIAEATGFREEKVKSILFRTRNSMWKEMLRRGITL